MNVTVEEKPKGVKKRLFIYILILMFCVIAVGIAMYQFFADEKLGLILGITNSTSSEEYELLKADFDNIFNNTLNGTISNNITINKINQNEDIIYTNYQKTETSLNNYEIDVNIPIINIDNEIIAEINEEIKDNFEKKAESTLNSENKNIIYTVEYTATITDDILSLAISVNLKEGNNAQRKIVQTYNYDLKNNREVTLSEMLDIKEIDEKTAQEKIREEIKTEQEQADELRSLGYNIYARDYTSDIYDIDNSTEFFIYNNYLYVVYAYGNQENTSELDLVIF